MNWPAFANPWMLAALAAVGLPVLIHYLTRARPRRVAFPPFKFLIEACAGQQAVHRLRTILLLSVRTLAVLALVLLFARPLLKPSGAAANPDAHRRVVLLLDASLSMRAVQRGVSLFGRAQTEAADVLRALESGAEAAVILAGATPRPLLPALSRNIPTLHEQLVQAQPTFENGDPTAALTLAQKMLGGGGTVYVFSDFQKSNWETVRDLPGGVVCRLRPVTTEPIENVALTLTKVIPSEPVIGEPAEVICTVFNCTRRPREENVRLELGDATQEKRLTLPAFGATDIAFNVTFPRPGPFAGSVSLQPDDFREDDVRHLAVRVNQTLQLLLLSDTEDGDPRSAAFYISRALAPSPQAAPGLAVVRRHSQDVDRGILETADVFVLVAPAALSGETVEIISRRVNEGARLLVFLDGPAAPLLLPTTFAPPFQLLRMVLAEDGVQPAPGPRQLFAESDANDFVAQRFRRHYQNQVRPDRVNDVLFSYTDGSAALTLSTVGQGATVFANFPLTPDGGDFIGNPMFPTLLHELLRALRRGSEERAVTPGTAWTLDAPTRGESVVTVTDPEGKAVEAQSLASGRTTRLALPSARIPGVYRVKQADVLISAAAVNIDPRESDTRPLALEALTHSTGTAVTVVRDDEDFLLVAKARPLWPYLAAAAAALLALEMVLLAAWRRTSTSAGLGTVRPQPNETIPPRVTALDTPIENPRRPVGAK